MASNSSPVNLRPARRADLHDLSHLVNASNGNSVLHNRIALYHPNNPHCYYKWRRNHLRRRLATPSMRLMVAEDSSTGELLGLCAWHAEGESALSKKWEAEAGSLGNWVERQLVSVEEKWNNNLVDRCVDWRYNASFLHSFKPPHAAPRPPCLHVTVITIAPSAQGRGIGKKLIDWGKAIAMEHDLPVFLESLPEAPGFYQKQGLVRLDADMVVHPPDPEKEGDIVLPVFVWEGPRREGRYLEQSEKIEGRLRWRDDAFPGGKRP